MQFFCYLLVDNKHHPEGEYGSSLYRPLRCNIKTTMDAQMQ